MESILFLVMAIALILLIGFVSLIWEVNNIARLLTIIAKRLQGRQND